MRWGLGPVFKYECLTNSRRWQAYALRSIGVAGLLLAMTLIATSNGAMFERQSWRQYAQLGEYYFYAMIGVELAMVMLAAPAATAGAICLDRARGTLAHMLMTDLSDAEIVLGKLAARLMPVMGLVACSWPVLAISSLLGGIDPIALTLAFAIIVAMAVLGCTIALTLSVWARKTHEVILTTYTVWILAALIWPIWAGLSNSGPTGTFTPPPDWTLLANPFYVAFAPYAVPAKLGIWDYLGFFGVTLGSSAGLTSLAVWRTRPVACRGSRDESRRPRLGLIGRLTRSLPTPSLDRNPVLWREWHRSRPSRWMMGLLTLLMGTTAVLCVVGAVGFWQNGAQPRPRMIWEVAGVCAYLLHVVFGLLILSAVAPTSMAEERQRGSLDILAATALSTRTIVIGKWLGTFRLAVPMAVFPGLMALAMATAHGDSSPISSPWLEPDFFKYIPLGPRIAGIIVVIATILAHGALIASIGIALAVWIKRQSRAIAISVGLFIFATAAWPIIANIAFSGPNHFFGRDLGSLSPVALCATFINFFTNRRYGNVGDILWSGTFWCVEVVILAMGLLWLTVRTFDDCFDRLPDRPGRFPVHAIVAIILIAMSGGASLVWAIGVWVQGFRSDHSTSATFLVPAYSLSIAIGLLLIASVSATSIPRRRRWEEVVPGEARTSFAPNGILLREEGISPFERGSLRDDRATDSPWRFVLNRWWKSFRLVLLVAIGPAILAMTLATAPMAPRYEAHQTKDAAGRQARTWTLADPNVPLIAEVPLRLRLATVFLLVVTILSHGAAGVSAGLALATSIRWTRRAVVAVIGPTVIVAIILPLGVLMMYAHYDQDNTVWNFVLAADSLLDPLVTRTSFNISDILWAVRFWDVVVCLSSAGLFWLTVRKWQRRDLGLREGEDKLESGARRPDRSIQEAMIPTGE
jgi:ABC-type transport system involved in multi-copper enzyme maturation permease subunit